LAVYSTLAINPNYFINIWHRYRIRRWW